MNNPMKQSPNSAPIKLYQSLAAHSRTMTRFITLIGIIISVIGMTGLCLTALSVSAASPVVPTSAWVDNFNQATLHHSWAWIREDASHWSLTERPGFLRITVQPGGLGNSPTMTKNLLLQQAPGGDFEIQTHLTVTPTANIQKAGLIVYQDDRNFVELFRGYMNFPPVYHGDGIYFMGDGPSLGTSFIDPMTMTLPSEVYLRIVRQSNVYTGYARLDGTDRWIVVGSHVLSNTFVPSRIGLFADSHEFAAPEIPADFDFFRLDMDATRVLLPLIFK